MILLLTVKTQNIGNIINILNKGGSKMNIKRGDFVVYQKCSCGEVNLTEGKVYEVLGVKGDLIMFYDDNGEKRVKTLKSRCFKKVNTNKKALE